MLALIWLSYRFLPYFAGQIYHQSMLSARMLTSLPLPAVIVLSELKQAVSYSQSLSSWLFDNVIASDGSVSASFITFDPAAAHTALGDSCLSLVPGRSGGELMPALTSLLCWGLAVLLCALSAAVGSWFFLTKKNKTRCLWGFFKRYFSRQQVLQLSSKGSWSCWALGL